MKLSDNSLELLSCLEKRSSAERWTLRQQEIEDQIVGPFSRTIDVVASRLEDFQSPRCKTSLAAFRPYRDLRFAQERIVQHPHVSGILTQGGAKIADAAMLYVRLTSRGGFAALGFYRPSKAVLAAIRAFMVERPDEWLAIVHTLSKRGRDIDPYGSLIAIPRGYASWSSSPLAPYLKLKSFTTRYSISSSSWIDGSVVDQIVRFVEDCRPLLRIHNP